MIKPYVNVNTYMAKSHYRFLLWGDNCCEIPYHFILLESAGQAAGISKTTVSTRVILYLHLIESQRDSVGIFNRTEIKCSSWKSCSHSLFLAYLCLKNNNKNKTNSIICIAGNDDSVK